MEEKTFEKMDFLEKSEKQEKIHLEGSRKTWISNSYETLPLSLSRVSGLEKLAKSEPGSPVDKSLRKVTSVTLPSRPKTAKPFLLQPRSLEHQLEILQRKLEELTQQLSRQQTSQITTLKADDALIKAVFQLQISFDYMDSRVIVAAKMLQIVFDLTKSDSGFIAQVEKADNEKYNLKLLSAMDQAHKSLFQVHKVDVYEIPSNSLCGIALSKKQPSIFYQPDLDSSVPNPYNANASPIGFCLVPLLRTSGPLSTPIGIIGLGRSSIFTKDYLNSITPYFTACEVLLEAHMNRPSSVDTPQPDDREIHEIISKFKHSETGVQVKDRKLGKTVYPQCFIGREAVTWLLENASHIGVKSREDAVRLGNRIMHMGEFQDVTKEHNFQDTDFYYIFKEDLIFLKQSPSPPSSSQKLSDSSSPVDNKKKRKSSFLYGFAREEKETIHSMILRKDYAKLKRKLSQKKVVELLEAVNEYGLTGLQYAIDLNDYSCVEIILQAYKSNLNKLDIHVKEPANGYTAFHMAAECSNSNILEAILSFPTTKLNKPNKSGNTPFHCFCAKFQSPKNLPQLVNLFLERGASVNAQNNHKETSLHKAVLNQAIRFLLVPLLLKNGADCNAMNNNGETPLHYAIHLKRKDLLSLLIVEGADIELKASIPAAKSPLELAQESSDETVVTFFNQAKNLSSWLENLDMKQYFSTFVRERMFLDLLPYVDERTLKEDIGVNLAGEKLKFLQAIEKLKQEAKQKELEEEQKKKNQTQQVVGDGRPRTFSGRQKLMHLRQLRQTKIPVSQNLEERKKSISDELKHGSEEVNWIKYSDLEFTELLGSGTSGDVYRGYYLGEEVAIKVLEREGEEKEDDFKNEFKVLNSVRGSNIVHFFGACVDPKPCLVMEYCNRGSLYGILNNKNLEFGWKEFFKFAIETCRAIYQLHLNDPQIVHRDLKSMNFLVTQDWTTKVCDFGLSRFSTTTNMATFYQLRGTMNYCAPETFEGKQYTTKSDIYSIGILLWEMLYRCITGEYQRPYGEFPHLTQPLQIIIQVAHQKLRPTIPNEEECYKPLVDLIKTCWDPNPDERPDTGSILRILKGCHAHYKSNAELWPTSRARSSSRSQSPRTLPEEDIIPFFPINNNSSPCSNNSNSTTSANPLELDNVSPSPIEENLLNEETQFL